MRKIVLSMIPDNNNLISQLPLARVKLSNYIKRVNKEQNGKRCIKNRGSLGLCKALEKKV